MGAKHAPLQQRFWRFVIEAPEGCWVWIGSRDGCGYGMLKVSARVTRRAHIVAYELNRGPVPAGLELDHLCRNTSCVNPAHLEAVTRAENNKRMHAVRPRKTQCKKGHRLSGQGSNRCRVCQRERNRLWMRTYNRVAKENV